MLSVIIPTYNSDKTINRCINSILRIKNIQYEIIIIDDGSQDTTSLINKGYSQRYSNVHAYVQHHAGVASARNKGLKLSNGQIVCFVDSDDYIKASYLERLINDNSNKKTDLIISNIKSMFGGNLLHELSSIRKNNIYKCLNINQFLEKTYPLYGSIYINTVIGNIYRKSVIKRHNIYFPKDVDVGEDLSFNLQYIKYVNCVSITSLIYYIQKVNVNSITHTIEEQPIKDHLIIFKFLKSIYKYYRLPIVSMSYIKLRMSYSILLNSLRFPRNNRRRALKNYLKYIYKYNLIPVKIYNYKIFECSILKFIIVQPSINVLYFFLIIIKKL